MEVYIIRHGESETNQSGLHCGWTDAPLTPLGHEQAKMSGRLIKHIHFDKVYASDLIRARQTAEDALPGYSCHFTDKIREINVGRLSCQSPADCLEKYGCLYTKAKDKHDFREFEGESSEEMMERIISFMRQLESLNAADKVAVVAHEGTARCILNFTLEHSIPGKSLKLDNGAISRFSYEYGVWKLGIWNYSGCI